MAGRFAPKRAWRASPSPMISFTFDDFPQSALTVGGKLLLDHGWRGTYYAAMGLMGKPSTAGPIFTRGDLDDLLAAGHELACHTFNHTSCFSVATGEFSDGCAENRRRAKAILGGYELRNFSFPNGHVTLAAKLRLRPSYDTCRSIEWGINSNPADFACLRANPIYSRLPLEKIKDLIHENSRLNGWLILYTHDIATNPSPHGCTSQYFEEVLRSALESGADVVTICEAASRYSCGQLRSETTGETLKEPSARQPIPALTKR